MPIITKSELQEVRNEYQPHFNSIDNEVVTEDLLNGCPECGSKQRYEGYKGFGEYRAFAVCINPKCDCVEDF